MSGLPKINYQVSELLGSDIYNDKTEKIGNLDYLIVGSNEEGLIAVIAVGGLVSMGYRKGVVAG